MVGRIIQNQIVVVVYIHTYNLYLCVKSKIAVIQPLTGDTNKGKGGKGKSYFCFTYLSAEGSCNGVVCDAHAQCVQPLDGPPNCECVEGWTGDGQTCSGKTYISCSYMKIYNIIYADRG